MISYVLTLLGKRLALPHPWYGPQTAANIGIAAPVDAPVNVPLGILCWVLAALVFMVACHCILLTLRGEFELGIAIALPVAEFMIGICAATVVTLPALVLYGLGLLVLRALQPTLLSWRQSVDEKKARFQMSEHPADQSGYEWLSRILADQGRYAEAAVPLEAWLRRDPENRGIKRKAELLRQQAAAGR